MARTIVILFIVAVCAFMAGWFTIDRNENETTIRFNREEIREDTSAALARGREFLENQEGLQQSVGGFVEQSGFVPEQPSSQQATLPSVPWQQPGYPVESGQQF